MTPNSQGDFHPRFKEDINELAVMYKPIKRVTEESWSIKVNASQEPVEDKDDEIADIDAFKPQ